MGFIACSVLVTVLTFILGVLVNWLTNWRPMPRWIRRRPGVFGLSVVLVILASAAAGVALAKGADGPGHGGARGTDARPGRSPAMPTDDVAPPRNAGPGSPLITAAGECVRTLNGSTEYDKPIVAGGCGGSGSQRWWLLPTADGGVYRLVNDVNRCLGAKDVHTVYQGTRQERKECLRDTHYRWRVTELGAAEKGWWKATLANVGRGGCLRALPRGTVGLTTTCDGRDSQVFRLGDSMVR